MMMVPQAFEQFIRALEPTSREAREATRQQQHVFENMKQRLRPKETILSGSYGRGTAIRPLHDIDLFLVLASEPVPPRQPASEYLSQVSEALLAAYPGKQPRPQRRSVNVEFSGTDIGFDIVPALEDPARRDVYWVPERESGQWISSNPRRHKECCDAANGSAGNMLKPLIKLLKRWNQLQGKPVSSFLLEAISYQAFTSRPERYPEGLAHLFQFASERIKTSCPDPARLGPPIDAGLDANRRQQAAQRLLGAARKSLQALQQERGGHIGAAHSLWADLLGSDYPAR